MLCVVTGANGFIGRHLVRAFEAAGWSVRGLVRADLHAGNAELERAMLGADVTVHLAGATRAPSERQLRESNVALTQRVMVAARAAGVRRFVYVSSQAAAGPAAGRESPVTESAAPRPIEAYGLSKLEAEQLVRSEAGSGWVVVRPAAVYGPGDRDFLAMFRWAARGVALHPGNREQWISIVHVRDLVAGIVSAATDPGVLGETFYLANDDPVQWPTLFSLAAACAGTTLRVDFEVPMPLLRLAATGGAIFASVTGVTPLLSPAKLALAGPRFWICSNQHARERLGFRPSIPLDDGLCDTYRWYKAQRWLG